MRYIVTGSSGFIGRRLCSALEARGDQVVKVDRVGDPPVDLLLPRAEGSRARRLERERGRIDGLFHLAANADWRACEENDQLAWDNMRMTDNALRLAMALGAPVVYASSATVYGTPVRSPIHERAQLHPEGLYALSKLIGEHLCEVYREKGANIIVARIFNIYGPGQENAVTYGSAFVPNLVRKLVKLKAEGGAKLDCFGEPWVTRDFIYIDDAVAALLGLMSGRAVYGRVKGAQNTFNVASGRATTHQDAVEILCRALGVTATLSYDHNVANDVGRERAIPYRGDMTAIAHVWGPRISVTEGFCRTALAMRDAP